MEDRRWRWRTGASAGPPSVTTFEMNVDDVKARVEAFRAKSRRPTPSKVELQIRDDKIVEYAIASIDARVMSDDFDGTGKVSFPVGYHPDPLDQRSVLCRIHTALASRTLKVVTQYYDTDAVTVGYKVMSDDDMQG